MSSFINFLFSSLNFYFSIDGVVVLLLFLVVIYLPFALTNKRRL